MRPSSRRHRKCTSWTANKAFKSHHQHNGAKHGVLFPVLSSLPASGRHNNNLFPGTESLTEYSSQAGCRHTLEWIPRPLSPPPPPPSQLRHKRPKRSTSFERTIEILVVADESMRQKHGEKLKSYVLTLMAGVAHIFEHSSIGNWIKIRVASLVIMGDGDAVWSPRDRPKEPSSAQTALRNFCEWQHKKLKIRDKQHFDTAILLTRRDLCRNSGTQSSVFSTKKGRTLCDTLGLAHSGRICDPESSCAIIEDNGLAASFTIAHELGHVLGVPHDEEEKCRAYYNTTEGHEERSRRYNSLDKSFKESNVMARMIDYNSHMWSWSPCSKHFITEFLE